MADTGCAWEVNGPYVEMGTSENLINLFVISHLGKSALVSRNGAGSMQLFRSGTPWLASGWGAGGAPGPQVPRQNWCGFPKVWVATAVFADPQHLLIPCHGKRSMQLRCEIISVLMCTDIFLCRNIFILLLLWMYCISKHYNPTPSEQKCFRRGREWCAKFLFQAFLSADLRCNSGVDNKCITFRF